ncbi:hypothetical protein [Psychrobacter sp. 72-O-c]|uniref:hypothetical protein n=1 Tax=Psychrobacter sp. 72-O-c TaxID=2774125 RepID=UPI0019194AAE|nr:hypothetical protein [Psychrobacter sp. 72-O-c]
MSLTKRQEAYCQNVAEGLDDLDAMADAGYKAKNQANAERSLKNLNDNEAVQNRITELRAINLLESGESPEGETAEVVELVNALHFFETVYKDRKQPMKTRISCAAIAIQYEEPKPAPVGKKIQGKLDAKAAANSGHFRTLSNQLDLPTSRTTQ